MTARSRAALAALRNQPVKGPIVYSSVPKLWPNETCVILACGPSLCAEDVDYCRGKARIIAVNDAHRLAPWADVLWATDGRFWDHYGGLPAFTGLKYGLTVDPRKWPDVHRLKNTGERGLELDPSGVRTGLNSGYAAIGFAFHCGVKRILLLGYDLGHPPGRSHFFGDHPLPLRSQSPYPRFLAAFQTIVQPLTDAGVAVVNCTRGGALNCFQRASLVDALPERREDVA